MKPLIKPSAPQGTLRRGRHRTRADAGTTRALDRGLAVLEILAAESPLPLAEIARRAGQSSSTTFRMLETLRKRGFAAQAEDTGLYRVGVKALEVGSGFLRALDIGRLAVPIMRKLAEDSGETVSLAVRHGSDAVYVEQLEGSRGVRMRQRVGSRLPLHASASGKALSAWLWEERLDEALGPAPYRRLTSRSIDSRSALMADLAAVRSRGYARDDEEFEADLRCIAAPVRDRTGEVTAALSLSALASRLAAQAEPRAAEALLVAADELTRRLGGKPASGRESVVATSEDIFLDG
ncbi:MAG: IclR family transcriptional regulator [Beijerinckiaceae bacterium]